MKDTGHPSSTFLQPGKRGDSSPGQLSIPFPDLVSPVGPHGGGAFMVSAEERQKAVDSAMSQIERQCGKGTIMRLGEGAQDAEIATISTGCLSLDLALGIGGVPRGRVLEIYGPESSGKTTLALHVIAEAQRTGGLAAFIDVEHALDVQYARKLGVKADELLISQPNYGEQALEIAEILVRSNAIDVIVIDSVAALVPKAEIEGDMGDAHVGLQARLMSQALRKLTSAISKSKTCVIFINQIRMKIGVMYGCFDYHARVVLADGTTEKIGKIVNQRLPVDVLSMDAKTGDIAPRRVVNWFRNGNTDEWLSFEIVAGGGSGRRKFTCTANHLIFTPRGERRAGDLAVGDRVMVAAKHYDLHDDQRRLIVGGILGDGSLRYASECNVAFRVCHGEAQRSYCEWKREVLAPFAREIARTGKGIGFDTIPMGQLAAFHAQAYGSGRRRVSDEMLAAVDARAVAVWYGDDGTFSGHYDKWDHGKAEIGCVSLSMEDKERLAERLEQLGMGRPTVRARSLLFSGDRARRLHERIAPYLHPSMDYKLHPDYRGRFVWHPDTSDAHLNGGRLASRTSLKAVPMEIAGKTLKLAAPRHRTRFDLEVEGNHSYLVDHVAVHNSPETTTGGNALKFYATLRLEIRRTGPIKEGSDVVGNRTRVKVVKNKIAPPFKETEFDIVYGRGISREGDILDLAVENKIIDKAGTWYSYNSERLGQGRENAKTFLRERPELLSEIEKKVRELKDPAYAERTARQASTSKESDQAPEASEE